MEAETRGLMLFPLERVPMQEVGEGTGVEKENN